jgi:hypothetical protein
MNVSTERDVSLEPPMMRMAAHVPGTLMNAASREAIAAVVDRLPASVTDRCIFEVRLGDEPAVADFSCMCTPHVASDGTADERTRHPLEDVSAEHQIWMALRRFARHWSPEDRETAMIRHLWLEFDTSGPDPAVPCVFAGVSREDLGDLARLTATLDRLGAPLTSVSLDLLDRCFHLPAIAGDGVEIGGMRARGRNDLRLVFNVDMGGVRETLAALGASGEGSACALAAELSAVSRSMNLSIDVGQTIGPAIGFECQLSQHITRDRARWADVLDHLMALGCCTPAKRDATLEWPGGMTERTDDDFAPAIVLRKISHVKVVWEDGAPLRAKAYLLARAF